jgi:hypothetical protein
MQLLRHSDSVYFRPLAVFLSIGTITMKQYIT